MIIAWIFWGAIVTGTLEFKSDNNNLIYTPQISFVVSPGISNSEKISNEISTTAGYEFNKNNSVLATSGNNKFKFDIKQQGFAWMTSNKKEKIMVKIMKKGSRIMVTGYNEKGSQTIDHYSLLGFTKAYNTAKKACS